MTQRATHRGRGFSLLSDERHARIVEAVSLGATQEVTAKFAGISLSTLEKWLEQGRRERRGKYGRLADDVDRAWAEHSLRAHRAIERAEEQAEKGDHRAAAWVLETKHRDAFGKRLVVETPEALDKTWDAVKGLVSDAAWKEFVHALGVLAGEVPQGDDEPDDDSDGSVEDSIDVPR